MSEALPPPDRHGEPPPIGQPGPGDEPPPGPLHHSSEAAAAAPPKTAPGAVAALLLGLAGLFLLPLFAPFAWAQGRRALRDIDASGGRLTGRTMATIGKWLGIVVTLLLILAVVAGIAFVVAAVLLGLG